MAQIWPTAVEQESVLGAATVPAGGRALYIDILALTPSGDMQAILKGEALRLAVDLAQSRQILIAQQEGHVIPVHFIIVVATWLAILYCSFGLFSPFSAVAGGGLALSAISVCAAFFLILELAGPFEGLIRLPSAPINNILAHLGH
ncbi:MAG: hypothetical protein WD715_04705 [Dongiaceae bacterium]